MRKIYDLTTFFQEKYKFKTIETFGHLIGGTIAKFLKDIWKRFELDRKVLFKVCK